MVAEAAAAVETFAGTKMMLGLIVVKWYDLLELHNFPVNIKPSAHCVQFAPAYPVEQLHSPVALHFPLLLHVSVSSHTKR